MKKVLALLLLSCVLFMGCSSNKVIGGVEYRTYGLLNQDARKNPKIAYEPCWGNIVWGVLLFSTAVGPIYFFGFDMFEPVGVKSGEPR